MAIRPFTFGVRLRERGRTIDVRAPAGSTGYFVVEDSEEGRQTVRRVHPSLGDALKDTATTWRSRLH
jgi:hypothetical protein